MKKFRSFLAAVLFSAGTVLPVWAGESQFGFVVTTDLLPKDQKEIEQWGTWRFDKYPGGTFNLLEGKTAFEYGVTDNFQAAAYLTYDWTEAYHNGPFGQTVPPEPFSYDNPGPDDHYHGTRFVGFSLEGTWRLLSPYTDGLGLALYEEPTVGPGFIENETRLVLQKNFLEDTLVFALNFTYAPELRFFPPETPGDDPVYNEETDANIDFGASYRFASEWSIGFELLNEREYNSYDFTEDSNNGYFLGPSLHYGGKDFFLTALFVAQMPWATVSTDTVDGAVVNGYDYDNDFEKYRIRVKFGTYL